MILRECNENRLFVLGRLCTIYNRAYINDHASLISTSLKMSVPSVIMFVDYFINQPQTQEADIRPFVDQAYLHISEHKHTYIKIIQK